MNKLVSVISDYIVNSNIFNIDLRSIIESKENIFLIYGTIEDLYSYKTSIRVFQKLVLYDYCFDYLISQVTLDELDNINNFILKNTKELYMNIDDDTLQFFNWCKIYNKNNKNKINIIVNPRHQSNFTHQRAIIRE